MATNEIFDKSTPLDVTVSDPTTPASGDPVRWGTAIGVALNDEDTVTGKTVVKFEGVFDLSVKGVDDDGNSAVVAGDDLYYLDGDTPKISKKISGYHIGKAMEAVDSGATATIRVVVGAVGTPGLSQIADLQAADIADGAITRVKLAGGFAKAVKVAGQDETGDTTIPVTGMVAGDELVKLFVEDGTSGKWTERANTDFTVGAGVLTVGANAANNAVNAYIIFWNDLT